MDELFCKKCGRAITDGWVSKSGYCHPCASEIRMEREQERKAQKVQNLKKRWWIIALILFIVFGVGFASLSWPKSEWNEMIEKYMYVGTIAETNNAVYIGVVVSETNFSDRIKQKICNSLYVRDINERPNIDITTVIIIDDETQEIYQAFSKYVDGDKIYDLDDDMAMAGFILAQDAG
jgi:hypothetical protein